MWKDNINANPVRAIEDLYDNAISAVQMNDSLGEWFRTTVEDKQECPLKPTLFLHFSPKDYV